MPFNEKLPPETPDDGKPEESVDKGDNVKMDPVYYYSREHRLSRASPRVQDLNDGRPIRPSLSKTLFATKGNIMVFIVIVLFTIFGFATRLLGRERDVKLGENTLALAIVREEEMSILGIAKNAPKSGEFYTGPVDIAVSPVMTKPKEGEAEEAPQLFIHRIYFNPVDSETYQLALPFGGADFFVILKTDNEQKSLRLKVENKKH